MPTRSYGRNRSATSTPCVSREDETLPSLVVDGIFGPATQQAVLTLQRQLGFDPTGAVGPVLWAQIITLGEEY